MVKPRPIAMQINARRICTPKRSILASLSHFISAPFLSTNLYLIEYVQYSPISPEWIFPCETSKERSLAVGQVSHTDENHKEERVQQNIEDDHNRKKFLLCFEVDDDDPVRNDVMHHRDVKVEGEVCEEELAS